MNQPLLERNLLALSARHPHVSTQLSKVEKDPDHVRFVLSRTEKEILCFQQGNRPYPLHSLVDPEKEGKRYLETYPPKGFFVFLGLGCGYHILPFLDFKEVTSLLILDTEIEVLRAVLNRIDLRKLLLDPRVSLLIDPSPSALEEWLLSHYFPSISGDIKTVPLLSRVNLVPNFFHSCVTTLQKVIETLSTDFTVQTQFGKKWFTNALSNLPVAENSTMVLTPKRKALITAAGPSLERFLPELRNQRGGGLLIATDTSLSVLVENDITPDVVISIDCQHISYHHFLKGLPEDVPLVLDLTSPPFLTRLTKKVVFFTSPHPFTRYVSTYWRRFPWIDTSGGNVTHAAVSLALSLGAEQIFLYGADFSFPRGKSYARGTYLYPYFTLRSSRLHSLESFFIDFLFNNQKLEKKPIEQGFRYIPKRMVHYRTKLEELLRDSGVSFHPALGEGEPIQAPPFVKPNTSNPTRVFSAGPKACSWKEFLLAYRTKLQELPPPFDPVISYFDALSLDQRNLWMTLLPISAVIRKEKGNREPTPSLLLSESLEWAMGKIGLYL